MQTKTTTISIFLNTWKNYNENGAEGGAWFELPCDLDEARELIAKKTGEDVEEAEFFVNDYETDISGLEIDEYSDIDELNDIAEELENLDDYDREKLEAIIESEGGSLRNALDNLDNCIYYPGYTLEDVAREQVEEGYFGEIPDAIANYIDYEAIARDLDYSGYTETESGVIVIC